MIDIIIPAYNSRKTIINTVASIATQSIRKEVIVTIVNDGGCEDYANIVNFFKPFINICEIGYKTNAGPGFARQYGVNHTNADFIVFIDADDVLSDKYALERMKNAVEEQTQIVLTAFTNVGKDKKPVWREPNSVEIFAHLFRRSFLENNEIKMFNIRTNEDVGYNTMCNLIALHQFGIGAFAVLYESTYIRYYNENSITNAESFQEDKFSSYIYSLTKAYNFVEEKGVTFEEMAENIVETLYNCYYFYNIALTKQLSTLQIKKTSQILFDKYWDKVKCFFSQQQLEHFKIKMYNIRKNIELFDLKYSFENFVKEIQKGDNYEK